MESATHIHIRCRAPLTASAPTNNVLLPASRTERSMDAAACADAARQVNPRGGRGSGGFERHQWGDGADVGQPEGARGHRAGAGAAVDSKDTNGGTALMLASQSVHEGTV